MKAEKHYEEFIRLLNFHKVKYLIIGAYALTYHAAPRNTGDIDFFVQRNKQNAKRLVKVLHAFGFKSLSLTENDFLEKNTVVQLGFEPNRIDIINAITGVTFETAYKNKADGFLGREKVSFISVKDLIRNKKALGRAKDLADVEMLENFHSRNKKDRQ
jgi:hypothetical protein